MPKFIPTERIMCVHNMDPINKINANSTNSIVFLSMLITVLIFVMSFVAAPVAAQAQESPIQEDAVNMSGSTITLELADGAAAAAVDSFNPEGVEVSDVSGVGQPQSNGGVVWNGPSGDTVSFTLTPSADQEVGDTITFNAFDGAREVQNISVEVTQGGGSDDGGADTGGDGNDTNTGETITSGPIDVSNISIDGSTVAINLADGAAAAAVGSVPDDAEVSDVSGAGQPQPDGGVVWNGPSGDTVSFTLTPTGNQEIGDTITFNVFNGSAETTVTVGIVDEISNSVPPINENNVSTVGSTITINLADDAASAAVSSLPENADVSNVGAGQIQPDGGVVWNDPSGDTVNFTLTPSADQEVGDTITFSVFDGTETTSASVEIIPPEVPNDFPGSENAFRAIDSDNTGAPFGSIELSTAIASNGNFQNYPNLDIGTITLAQVLKWNSEQDQ